MKRLITLITFFALTFAGAQTPSLSISDQTAMGTTVTLGSVTLAEDGFVVIHALDANGELVLTPPLGLTYLSAGTSEVVEVELDPTLLAEYGYGATTKDVVPMLHIDANANQNYEFPEGPDVPVMMGGAPITANLTLTLDTSMMSGGMMDDAMTGGVDDTMMGSDMTGGMSGTMSGGAMMNGLDVSLSGAQEVPPVMTEAVGSATVSLSGDTLTVRGDFSNLSSPLVSIAGSSAHIHIAAAGENGDVIYPLDVSAAEDGSSGLFSLSTTLTPEQVSAFEMGNLYINVHTEMNQSGEIRAQIEPEM